MRHVSDIFVIPCRPYVLCCTHLVVLGLTEQAHARVESTPVAYIKMQNRAA